MSVVVVFRASSLTTYVSSPLTVFVSAWTKIWSLDWSMLDMIDWMSCWNYKGEKSKRRFMSSLYFRRVS
jgi:hypothetical protein